MIRKTGSLVLLAVSGDLAQILSTSFNLRYLQQYVTEKVKQVHVKEYEKKRTVVCLKCQRLSYTVLWSQLFRILALNHLAAHNALVGELILWKWLIILSFFPFKFIHSMHCRNTALEVSVNCSHCSGDILTKSGAPILGLPTMWICCGVNDILNRQLHVLSHISAIMVACFSDKPKFKETIICKPRNLIVRNLIYLTNYPIFVQCIYM